MKAGHIQAVGTCVGVKVGSRKDVGNRGGCEGIIRQAI